MNECRVEDGVVWIALTQGKWTCVDLKNWHRISEYRWYAVTSKVRSKHLFYAQSRKGGKNILLHKLLCRGVLIDHRDGDGLNNLEENLRAADHSKNIANSKLSKKNSSGFKGVYYNRHAKKWMAQIRFQLKRHYLGLFQTPEKAAHAYDIAALELFGDFARLNFPVPEQAPTQPLEERQHFRGP